MEGMARQEIFSSIPWFPLGEYKPKFINTILSVSSLITMDQPNKVQFLSLDKTEDQLVVAVFACVLLSFFFGLQDGLIPLVLWVALGAAALICIYFAFPHMWPYAMLLYACYGISAFSIVLIVFWYDALSINDVSLTVLLGAFLIFAAFYMAYHMINYIKKARDTLTEEDNYIPLGFWSLAVMLFVAISILSIISWSFWANENHSAIQAYVVFEPLLGLMLIYILWLPDRALDWSKKPVPESPATRFIVDKSKVITGSFTKSKTICPECGNNLRMEKKQCPSCSNPQTFGWCSTSETFVLPCAHCGTMNLYGKENCTKCKKRLSTGILCNKCDNASSLRDWASPS
jgi:hypothetical protein